MSRIIRYALWAFLVGAVVFTGTTRSDEVQTVLKFDDICHAIDVVHGMDACSKAALNTHLHVSTNHTQGLPKKLSSTTKEPVEWTLMLYIQAKNNLHQWAADNLYQIARQIGATDKVQILVQWYQPGQVGTWRYKIEQNNIKLESVVEKHVQEHTAEELVNFVRWCVQGYPAQKYALILWNHGLGVLDPNWGAPIRLVQNPLEIAYNQRISVPGVVESTFFDHFHADQRGILFNESTRTYMDNAELVRAFKTITRDVLGNKKIDIIGMDACYMQMVEIAYQLAPYGKYLVASQDVELAQGWNYADFVARLIENPSYDPRQFAESVVSAYEKLYKGKTNLFTQSALELGKLEQIKENIHDIAIALMESYEKNPKETRALVRQARNKCQQFSLQTYIDLHSFYVEIYKQLIATRDFSTQLHEYVCRGINLLEECVISNTASTYFGRAHGVSIYFPLNKIDTSYLRTCFAQDCAWVDFLCKSLAP